MAKLTAPIIEDLYAYGKAVYNLEIGRKDAVKKIISKYPESIADTSADFYIGLYSDYIAGYGSTWNQNSELVLYYVEHITKDYGKETGLNAFQASMKFAKAKSKNKLIGDLNALWQRITCSDLNTDNQLKTEVPVIPKAALMQIKAYIAARGFTYPEGLIENFYLSLKSKPFVILAGTSGTGKTRLVKLFAEAIGAIYSLVSVRPDWSDGTDIFGHTDLNGNFIEGPVCDAFCAAIASPDRPVLLCLDEMNLARVEYYLSDFLSVIEAREKTVGGKIVTPPIAQYAGGIPDNLYIIGTVNMDETTFPFSKKVLDRANTIEFSYVDLIPCFDLPDEVPEKLQLPNSFLRTEYLVLARDCIREQEYVREICAELQVINTILQQANFHVGYRVRDEIVFYMLNNKAAEALISHNEAFDNEILQKLLPRIQGSTASVKNMLCELFKLCAGDPEQKSGDTDSEKMRKLLDDASISCKYRRSAEKLALMVKSFEEDGFTSYWQ